MELLSDQIFDTIHIGIIILDSNYNIVMWNSWMEKQSEYLKDEILGSNIGAIVPILSKSIYQSMLGETINENRSWFCSSGIHKAYIYPKTKTDSDKTLRQNLQIDPINYKHEKFVLIQVFDQTTQHVRVNKLKKVIEHLEQDYQLISDSEFETSNQVEPISGFKSKDFFAESLTQVIEKLSSEEKIYVLYINFSIYDEVMVSCGEESANKLIKEISRKLRKHLPPYGHVTRHNGVFTLFMPHKDSFEEFIRFISELITSIDFTYFIDKKVFHTSPKLGISIYPNDGTKTDDLIKSAKLSCAEISEDSLVTYKFSNSMFEALNKTHLDLLESKLRYKLLFENMEEGFVYCKTIFNENKIPIDGEILEINNYIKLILNLNVNKIIGQRVKEIYKSVAKEIGNFEKILHQVLIDGKSLKIVEQYFPKQDMWFSINAYRINENYFSLMLSDITNSKKHAETISRLAFYDTLTELPNRKHFFDHAERVYEIAKRSSLQFAIAFIDFNKFKLINDLLGHDIGDEVLVRGAKILQNAIRKSDFVARIGGDEFIILFSDITDKNDIIHLVKRIAEDFDIAYPYGDGELRVTISIGISMYPDNGDNLKDLISSADQAMYKVKASTDKFYLFSD